jgi:hypothetical protein
LCLVITVTKLLILIPKGRGGQAHLHPLQRSVQYKRIYARLLRKDRGSAGASPYRASGGEDARAGLTGFYIVRVSLELGVACREAGGGAGHQGCDEQKFIKGLDGESVKFPSKCRQVSVFGACFFETQTHCRAKPAKGKGKTRRYPSRRRFPIG